MIFSDPAEKGGVEQTTLTSRERAEHRGPVWKGLTGAGTAGAMNRQIQSEGDFDALLEAECGPE